MNLSPPTHLSGLSHPNGWREDCHTLPLHRYQRRTDGDGGRGNCCLAALDLLLPTAERLPICLQIAAVTRKLASSRDHVVLTTNAHAYLHAAYYCIRATAPTRTHAYLSAYLACVRGLPLAPPRYLHLTPFKLH